MISERDKTAFLDIAETAIDHAGDLVRTRSPGQLRVKGDRDLASEVDLAVERSVRAYLQQKTPDVGFLGEEEGSRGPVSGLRWVLDPIDGTVNFLHGYPLCAVAIALIDGESTLAAVIELPFLGQRYTALLGRGSFADGRRLSGSSTTELGQSLVAVDQYTFGPESGNVNSRRHALIAKLASRVQRIRMIGASAIDLAWTAEGRLDACIMLGNKPWDTAAGILIAREAGVRVLDFSGFEHSPRSPSVIAVTPNLEKPIMTVLRSAK